MADRTQTMLDAVEATGAGSSKSLGEFNIDTDRQGIPDGWTVEITTSGNATAVIVDWEGAIDGATTFHQLAQHTMTAAELSADKAMFHVINKGILDVRANMTTFTQAASETVTVKATPFWNG